MMEGGAPTRGPKPGRPDGVGNGAKRKGIRAYLRLRFCLQTRHRPEGLTLRGDGARAGKLRQLFLGNGA
jgi:hypothetical protein